MSAFKQEYRKRLALKSMNHDKMLNAKGFGDLYIEDGIFQIGAMPPVVGKKNIEAFVANFFGMGFKSIEHEFVHVWDLEDYLIFEAIATFNRLDGTAVVLNYVNVHTYRNELYSSTKIFIDTHPLMG